jgi:hypothetical protein
MRSTNGSVVGLILVGMMALAPAAAFAHGGGGGGHAGGGGHFGGFAGHSFAGHGFTGHGFGEHQGARFAQHGDHFRHEGDAFFGGPFFYDYPYGYDYPYYGYYDDNAGQYSQVIIAVQQELTQLGYYHGRIDGFISPEMEGAIRWFQSVDHLPVTGQIDDRTLKALGIS